MKRQYLHLSVYPCERCEGPVASASLAVRENEISNESDIRELGAICLSCCHRQSAAGARRFSRQFPPVEWPPGKELGLAEITRRVEMDRVCRD
jgi:hypothetical protein